MVSVDAFLGACPGWQMRMISLLVWLHYYFCTPYALDELALNDCSFLLREMTEIESDGCFFSLNMKSIVDGIDAELLIK
jgi:hypothetical protein